ncbi:MAG TPA: hypothetical protein ENI23_18055 [bacterium]|nr:hypothetical protein [bacterium]
MTRRKKNCVFILSLVAILIVMVVLYLSNVREGVNLLVAFGTVGMTLVIFYIEVIRPWIRKPEIKIEFTNKIPYCRHARTKTGLGSYYADFAIVNSGQTSADDCEAVLERVWN